MPRRDDDENDHHIAQWSAGELALFKDLADASAKSAVEQTFLKMGLDPSQPLVSQRYFQTLRTMTESAEENALDAAWVRRWRPRTEGLFGKIAAAILTFSVAGALSTYWHGFKSIVLAQQMPPHP